MLRVCVGSRIGDRAIWHAIRIQLQANAKDPLDALGSLAGWPTRIDPAVDAKARDGARTAASDDFVDRVAKHVVAPTAAQIRANSPVPAELESNASIRTVGSMYDLEAGVLHIDA